MEPYHQVPLQDGIHKVSEGTHPKGRLASQVRFEGCIPQYSPHTSYASQIPEILMEELPLAVQGTSIRVEQCPLHIYQIHEASGSYTKKAGCLGGPVPG